MEKGSFSGVPEHCEDLCFAGGRLYLSSGSCLYCVDMKSGRSERLTPAFLEAEWLIDRQIYPIFLSGGQLFLCTALGVVTYHYGIEYCSFSSKQNEPEPLDGPGMNLSKERRFSLV